MINNSHSSWSRLDIIIESNEIKIKIQLSHKGVKACHTMFGSETEIAIRVKQG